MRFDGKVVVVTGGGSGIGQVAVGQFASEGARVVVNDVNAAAANAVSETILSGGGRALAVPCDVSDRAAVERSVSTILSHFGRVDILINNAGIAHAANAVDYDVWDRMISIDLSGVFYWARAVASQSMIPNKQGAIVNVSSSAGFSAYPGDVGYIAAKHGVVGLTKALAIEWACHGIRVNCVCPGLTQTPILAEVEKLEPGRFDNDQKSTPLGRRMQPIEQVRVMAFLASDDASGVTGAIIPVDGGKSALIAGQELPAVERPVPPPPFQPKFGSV